MNAYLKIKSIAFSESSDKIIAQYILDNPKKILLSTIGEFSEEVFTTPPSIVRFCKRIGFSGFSEFKIALASEIEVFQNKEKQVDINHPITLSQSPEEIATTIYNLATLSLKNAYNNIDYSLIYKIADEISNSSFVSLWGIGDSLLFLKDFHWKLRQLGVIVISDGSLGFYSVPERNNNQSECAIIVSTFGDGIETELIIQKVKKTTNNIVVITTNPNSRFKKYAKYFLAVPTNENKFDKIAHYASHTVIQFSLDVLHAMVYSLFNKK